MPGLDALWPGGRKGDSTSLAREAAGGVANLLYKPPIARRLPERAPRRRFVPQPEGIGWTEPIWSGELHGVPAMVEYVNDHAPNPRTSCGPAANATLLTHWGVGAAAQHAGASSIAVIADRYPPTRLGMSPREFTDAARAEGLTGGGWVQGEAMLRAAIDAELPAVVLLDLLPIGGGLLMHWVVAHAYDNDYIYLTNWNGADGRGRMSWETFRKATNSALTRPIHTADRYLVVWPEG